MAAGTCALEALARLLGGALNELGPRLGTGQLEEIVADLGYDWSDEHTPADEVGAVVEAMTDLGLKLKALTAARDAATSDGATPEGAAPEGVTVDAGQPDAVAEAGVELLASIRAVLVGFEGLGTVMDSVLAAQTAGEPGGDDARPFARALLDYLLIGYLEARVPGLTALLEVLGLVERSFVDASDSRPSFLNRTLRLENLSGLVSDPVAYGRELYGWADPGFDGEELLRRLHRLFHDSGVLAALVPEDRPTELEIYHFVLRVDGDGLVAGLRFPGRDTEDSYPLGGGWSVRFTTAAQFEPEVAVSIRPPLNLAFEPLTGAVSAEAGLALVGEQVVLLSAGRLARLEAQRVTAGIELLASWDVAEGKARATPTFTLSIEGAKLVAAPRDGFVSSVTKGNPVDAGFDLTLVWSPETGLSVRGGAGLVVRLPVRASAIPFVDVNAAQFALDVSENGLTMRAGLDFGARLGPLRATVVGMGMTGALTFPSGDGQVAGAGPAADVVPPQSIGLGIESGLLRGGGYLDYDPDRKEYAGTLQLGRGNLLFTAVGLLTTERPDGQPGFSLIVLITGKFRPIRLGYGFTLTGIGGLIGANRTADVKALQQGVRDGALGPLMFPERPVEQAPQILSSLRTYFPESHGSYLFGPMVQLGWGPVPVMRAELGLVLEVPDPVRLLLFGRMDLGLPTLSKPVTGIHLEVLGVVDFDAGTLALDARLVDSRIGIYQLEGEAAIRARWKTDPDFALAIGGFHPQARPPAGFPALRRLTLNLSPTGNPKVRLAGYFALTSNSVQFGARVDAYAKSGKFSVEGFLSFDALFRFDPFRFVAELVAGAAIKRSGRTVLAVSLKLTLSGPQPWHVAGTASFRIIWKFTIRFSFTRGSGPGAVGAARSDLRALLVKELQNPSSWTGQLPARRASAVVLRDTPPEPGQVLMHPQGRLAVRQTVVPLGVTVDKYGEQRPKGDTRFELRNVRLGGADVAHSGLADLFAPAQYFDLTDQQRLRRPAFERYPSGLALNPDYTTIGEGTVLRPAYEETVVDVDPGSDPGSGPGDGELDSGTVVRGAPVEVGGPADEWLPISTAPVPTRMLTLPDTVPLRRGELARSSRRSAAVTASGFRQRVSTGPVPKPKLRRHG